MPRQCFIPSWSTISGGNTRDANARRKMAENSLSRPPMPNLLKFQSGLMIDWNACFPLLFPTRFKGVFSAFSNMTVVFPDDTPSLTCLDFPPALTSMAESSEHFYRIRKRDDKHHFKNFNIS
ncbi:hypothetical protein NP493_13g05019 [Ridgeia piscesae]|uniref:Uncharacterized protein n=1 Tax=Ridgeia piscesae TaxID=27915 RepID=A0AAD9UL03_RIDPI|nr:hypothetical protein NP493_13g05019 [Ridgeia piscesae]